MIDYPFKNILKEVWVNKLVLIGASTGGPGHLKKIFKNISTPLNLPIVVAQHMGKMFIPSFVGQFQNELEVPVFLLNSRTNIDTGGIYICEQNMVFDSNSSLYMKPLENEETIYNPNINALFYSAVPLHGSLDIMAILLTGIGDDGARGIAKLHSIGVKAIAESKESAIVYGMPKQAKELAPDLKVLNIDEIKIELEKFINVF